MVMAEASARHGVEILCIGTELLLGNILNSNARWLAEELAALGLPHYRQTVVGDNVERLKESVLEAVDRSRILITTGGLGPTPDDLTTETLAAAFETPLEERPELWFGDHSRRERPRLSRLEREIDKVVRSRLLNPRWIDGMKQHGYKGAFEMGASLDYLFAYDATTDRIPDWCYSALCEQWLEEKDIQNFLQENGILKNGY